MLLREFINCIMVVHARVQEDASSVVCYPPTPQNSIFFYINDQISVQKEENGTFVLQPRSVVVGLQSTRVTLDVGRDHKAVRVGFHPGGMYRLLGIPMNEMLDASYDAIDVFGTEMGSLNEKLQEAGNFDEIKDHIEQFLLKKLKALKTPLPFDRAMMEILRTNGNISIDQVASMACLSLRQFERKSKERIGVSPKFFSRLVRFSKAYRLREANPNLSWTNITYECGYFDQMHLIRDFKEFTGMNPCIIERSLENTPVRLQADMRL